ncbi:MAG: hypothetical protein ACM3XR_05430 [Bacillota bacterium]
MTALKIIAGILVLSGFAIVVGARKLVKIFNLDKKITISNESEMDEEEAGDYRLVKATFNVKLYGMLIALPGLILTLIAFK